MNLKISKMKILEKYISIAVAALLPLCAAAQQKISGTVSDRSGNPVSGALVYHVGSPSIAAMTDETGNFIIDAGPGDYMEVNFNGQYMKRFWVGDSDEADVVLGEADRCVDNRGLTSTLMTRTGAVNTVSDEAFKSNSSVYVRDLLYGLIPGLLTKQSTAWEDSGAELTVRGGGSLSGNSPLIVVDGIPRDIGFLNGADIESISVLKDGPATALWGVRGANGVIMVTTKRGDYSSMDVDVRYTFGVGLPVNRPEFVDGYEFALLKNEALHNDGLELEYGQSALDAFRSGSNPDLYPNTDWQKEALRSNSFNHQFDVSMRGGGKKVRYYAAINYHNDRGILNGAVARYSDRYTAQMDKTAMSVRLNLDADITRTTKLALSMYGQLEEKKRPNITEENIFAGLYDVPAAAFPLKTSTGYWGSNNIYNYNPVARVADVGYYRRDRRTLFSDLRLIQDLSALTPGLKAEAGIAYDNNAVYQETGSKTYAYETVTRTSGGTEDGIAARSVYGDDSALDITNGGLYGQFMRAVLDAKVMYDRAFGYHTVNGTLQYRQESYIPMGQNKTRRRQSYIFTGGYGYKDKYLVDVVVNYAGTSVLIPGHKFSLYPAVSAAWVVSNEPFLKDCEVLDYLKLRASWGRSGYDENMEYAKYKQYWISSGGYHVKDNPTGASGMKMDQIPVEDYRVEYADKYNFGIDFGIAGGLSVTADAYYNVRNDILLDASNLYSQVIGATIPKLNTGSVEMYGADAGITWRDRVGKDFSYYAGATVSWQRSAIIENAEGYQPYDYLSKKGDRLGQIYGLEAIGYFRDEKDIADSPEQMFSDVTPGDIKYKDQNGDGRIDDYDVVAIGHSSSIPDLYYGISIGFEYKGLALDAVFQGVSGFSQMLTTNSLYWPLRNNKANISKWYTEDNIRWTESTKDIATVPRLTTLDNANNFRNSTQWLVDASYFKLRNLSISYCLPKKWTAAMKMDEFRIFLRGNNLFSIDKVKYLNCEDIAVNYPDMMSFFAGININF